MSEEPAGSVTPSVTQSTLGRWAAFRKTMTVLYGAAMVAAVLGYVFVRQWWDPVMGPAMRNVMSYGIVITSLLLTGGWLVFCSPFRWKTVLAVLCGGAALAGAAAASVRTLEFDGDMGLVVRYRWEPTAEERLTAHRLELAATAGTLDFTAVSPTTSDDCPGYRGLDRRGALTGPPLSQDWATAAPRLLWKQPCGGGYSAFAVAGDVAVTLEQRGDNEAVVCYDARSGRERWLHEYPASFFEAMGGPGPRSTPTISEEAVFSLGAEGDLVCLDLATGELRWHVDALPEEAPNVEWGLSSSPLIVDNLVLVEAGGPQGDGLVAYDCATGDIVWQRPGAAALSGSTSGNRAGYSSPMLVTLHGVRLVMIFDGEGLRGHVPETGESLFFHEFRNGPGVNVAQPVGFEDGRIFLSQSYSVGCRMIRVTRAGEDWQSELVWENLNLKCKFSSPVLHDGSLYGLDEGILVCLDPQTGERRWKKGRYGNGQLLLINDQLLIISERGAVVLVAADPESFREMTQFPALDYPKVWNPHALARGVVYVRNHEEMAAYDLRAAADIGVQAAAVPSASH